uniref:Aldo_ket_red domain-containing protein n=1 Tax=Toxocara canis TaxID=6265 RepID=A0A183U5R5_TOXCA
LGSQAAVALTALHPSFIVQRIYAGCAASRHLQPLTATVPMGIKKSNIENVCARVGLPSIDLVIFQSALIETPTNVYDSDMFPLSSGAVTALLRESSLAVYAKQSGVSHLSRMMLRT